MAASPTVTVEYNSTIFSEVLSVRESADPVYSEDGRSILGLAFKFDISALITATPGPLLQTTETNSGWSVSNIGQAIEQVRVAMSVPRQRFIWKIGDLVMIDIGGPGSGATTIDQAWGPKPASLTISPISGGMSATVNFSIEALVSLCATDVREFWWKSSLRYDRNFSCERTITGVYRTSAQAVAGGTNAAQKFMTGPFWPPLPDGFYREVPQMETSADGTTLRWTIVDHQVLRMLPRPFTEGQVTYRIEQSGAKLHRSLNMTLKAPYDVDKRLITQFMVAMIKARFPEAIKATAAAGGRLERFTNIQFTNDELDNSASCSVSSEGAGLQLLDYSDPANPILKGLFFGDIQSVTPGSGDEWKASNRQAEIRPVSGTSGLIPASTPPADPCAGEDVEPVFGSLSKGGDYDRESSYPPGSSDSQSSPANPSFDPDSNTQPYTSYVEVWHYVCDMGLAVLRRTSGATHVVQQTGAGLVKCIQIGSARRLGAPPQIPQIASLTDETGDKTADCWCEKYEVRNGEPRVMADGHSLEFRANWTFVLIYPGALNLSVGATEVLSDISRGVFPYNPILEPTAAKNAQKGVLSVRGSDNILPTGKVNNSAPI